MSSPIPRRLLPHTATVERYIGTNKNGPVYGEPIDLENIRVVPVKQNALSSLGDAKNDRFLVFIDCKNSKPVQFVLAIKDRLTFQGQVMAVRTISPFYGTGREVHHYEVRLA
jgi:hypothetical protein